ncbi:glycosyltransferase, partial [Turicibacter sanguinis]|nr:glycosyltransferase [Turicibacter sanguinis]
MKKALITASVYGFIGSFEKSNINILLEQGYEVHVATNMSKELKAFGDIGQLEGINIIKHQISYSRSPLSFQTIKSYKAIKKLIKEENFDLIHCHTPVAAMLTRLAARKRRKQGTKVIYTAHGFHFFKGASVLNWLIYFPVEFICSFFTDILITINQEDYKLATKAMKAKKIQYIPGIGIDLNKFKDVKVNKAEKRRQLGVPEKAILLLSIGELSKRKNHQIIIEAIKHLNDSNVYYCIAGQGDLAEYLKNKVHRLGLDNRVIFLGFRSDVLELYQVSDIFAFPSLQEGLPVALMEAMAVGLPVIASDIRGNIDLIKNKKGGYLCNPNSKIEFLNALKYLTEDNKVIPIMKENNLMLINNFSLERVKEMMSEIYNLVI